MSRDAETAATDFGGHMQKRSWVLRTRRWAAIALALIEPCGPAAATGEPKAAAGGAEAANCASEAGASHLVADVVDGETIRLESGQEVRLIGALALRPPNHERAARALAGHVSARPVVLRYSGRKQDRYGRILAQVVAVGPGGQETWIQKSLIRAGLARAYALPGSVECLKPLMAAEADARSEPAGHWRDTSFAVRDALDVATLDRRAGMFEIVEGSVRQVTRTRDLTYINFGSDWRRDFTASIATRLVDREGVLERLRALAGQRVRVRGWIERRNGPMIVLASLDEIEIIGLDGDARSLAGPAPPAPDTPAATPD